MYLVNLKELCQRGMKDTARTGKEHRGVLLKRQFGTILFSFFTFIIIASIILASAWLLNAQFPDIYLPEYTLHGSTRNIISRMPEQDLSLEWFMVESEHFRIVFPLHLGGCADFIAAEAEDVFILLSAWTKFTPERKIDILLTDRWDHANGFVAHSTKGLFITIYTVYPYRSSSIGLDAYKNWYRNLLIHELSHIFHLDIVRGGSAVFKKIFGNVFYPNEWTAPFYIEGFATYSETVNESGFGRGNSPYTQMYTRTAFNENNFPPLDRASNNVKVWPLGQASRLFGVSFVNYLAEQYGEEKITDFNLQSGSYPMFTYNIPFKKVYGQKMSEAWYEWEEFEEKKSSIFTDKITAVDVTAFEPVGSMKGYVYSVCFNSTGESIAYSINPVEHLGGLYIYNVEDKTEKCIKKGLHVYNLKFSKDDKKIYYIRYDVYKNVYIKNNLYELDLSTGKERQITHTGNIQGFIILDHEKQFLASCSTPYGTSLSFIDFHEENRGGTKSDSKRDIKLYAGEYENFHNPVPVIEEPSLSPDGSLVAFSYKNDKGERGICLTSLKDLKEGKQNLRRVTGIQYNAYSPVWLDGNELVFIGDKNGVYNIYSVNIVSGVTRRITNVLNGVFEPDISRGGKIVLKEYTSFGFQASTGSMNDLDIVYWEEEADFELLDLKPQGKDNREEPGRTRKNEEMDKYRSGKWLFPGYWLPFMAGDGINLGVGFYTAGKDLLKKHVYKTGLVYDIIDDSFKSLLNYTYNTYPISYFALLFISQSAWEDEFNPEIAFYPGISFLFGRKDFFIQADLGVIFEDPYKGLNFSVSSSTTKSSIKWIGPEKGFSFQQEIYWNIDIENSFVVLTDYFSIYFRPFGIFLLNFRIQSKGGVGDVGDRIKSGLANDCIYVPLKSVYTMGYPEPIAGSFVLDFKTTLGFLLLSVNSGFRTFPLFFEGINLNLFNDNGLIVSGENTESFIITDIRDFTRSPFQYIRSSIGGELEWNFIIGYKFPFVMKFGYVLALAEGGTDGYYISIKTALPF